MSEDWKNAEVVNDWQTAEVVNSDQETDSFQAYRESDPVRFGPGGFLDALKSTGIGLGESVLSLGSALPASVLAGFGGLMSLGEGVDVAADRVRSIQDRLTYKPKSKVGESVTETLTNPIAMASEGITDLAGMAPGGPIMQTALKTGIEALPALAGRGRVKSGGGLSHQQRVLLEAQERGYVVPTSSANPKSATRGMVEGTVGGKPRMQQEASFRNQKVTNDLAAESLGLPRGTVITRDLLKGVRENAGQAYNALNEAGIIVPNVVYRRDLSRAIRDLKKVSDDLPSLSKADSPVQTVIDTVEGLNVPTFHGSSVVTATRLLRDEASAAYKAGQHEVGNAYRAASKALEDAAEAHLVRLGDPATVQAFRDARVQIAKSYSIEKALDGDGFVSASKLAGQRAKGEPLTGELDLIARFNEAFPQSSRVIKERPILTGRLSGMIGAGGLGFTAAEPLTGALIAGAAFGGPVVRAGLLSRAGQSTLGRPVPGLTGLDMASYGLLSSAILGRPEQQQ